MPSNERTSRGLWPPRDPHPFFSCTFADAERASLYAHRYSTMLGLLTHLLEQYPTLTSTSLTSERVALYNFLPRSVADSESHCAVILRAWLCSKLAYRRIAWEADRAIIYSRGTCVSLVMGHFLNPPSSTLNDQGFLPPPCLRSTIQLSALSLICTQYSKRPRNNIRL